MGLASDNICLDLPPPPRMAQRLGTPMAGTLYGASGHTGCTQLLARWRANGWLAGMPDPGPPVPGCAEPVLLLHRRGGAQRPVARVMLDLQRARARQARLPRALLWVLVPQAGAAGGEHEFEYDLVVGV